MLSNKLALPALMQLLQVRRANSNACMCARLRVLINLHSIWHDSSLACQVIVAGLVFTPVLFLGKLEACPVRRHFATQSDKRSAADKL